MCNCHSYNQDGLDSSKSPEVILCPPEELHIGKDSICVDACIAHVVAHLWENMIPTLNSCCGHNKEAPRIVLDEKFLDEYKACNIREIISEVDNRNFELFCWQLRNF